jgi:hypothetical protein
MRNAFHEALLLFGRHLVHRGKVFLILLVGNLNFFLLLFELLVNLFNLSLSLAQITEIHLDHRVNQGLIRLIDSIDIFLFDIKR